ncbi:MAG: hypothetical protein FWG18_02560, partial [Alphaproteobacteria bacterium]|nr:hypothetical protein [Alphaproteobacteria bacterium]
IAAKVAGCVCSVCSANVPAAIETGRGVFQEIQGFSAERKICAGKRSKQITIKELEDVVGVAKTSFKEVRGAFVKENDVPPPSDIGDVGIGL